MFNKFFSETFVFITFSIITLIFPVQGCIISGLMTGLASQLVSFPLAWPLLWFSTFGQKKKKKKSLSIANLIISLYSQTWKAVSFGLVSFRWLSPLEYLGYSLALLTHGPAQIVILCNSFINSDSLPSQLHICTLTLSLFWQFHAYSQK